MSGFCASCGAALTPGAGFCAACGSSTRYPTGPRGQREPNKADRAGQRMVDIGRAITATVFALFFVVIIGYLIISSLT